MHSAAPIVVLCVCPKSRPIARNLSIHTRSGFSLMSSEYLPRAIHARAALESAPSTPCHVRRARRASPRPCNGWSKPARLRSWITTAAWSVAVSGTCRKTNQTSGSCPSGRRIGSSRNRHRRTPIPTRTSRRRSLGTDPPGSVQGMIVTCPFLRGVGPKTSPSPTTFSR